MWEANKREEDAQRRYDAETARKKDDQAKREKAFNAKQQPVL